MGVDDSYTKALLHMDGADASTTFTDESGKTWTSAGNAQIDTAQSVFGGASGLFDGTGDYITTPSNTDFDFGTGDFTVDFRFRLASLATDSTPQWFIGQYAGATTFNTFYVNQIPSNPRIYFNSISSGTWAFSARCVYSSLAINTWYHLAYVRSGTTLYIFVNGTSQSITVEVGSPGNDWGSKGTPVHVGDNGQESTFMLDGWIDELRFSKGIARWTANFTPPTSAYAPASSFRPKILSF